MANYIDYILHLDKYVGLIIENYGSAAYIFIFFIVLLETGLVIAPFLPGDSLLFVAGTFAAQGLLNIIFLFILVSIAAILGDSLNYAIGHYFGRNIFSKMPLFKNKYLEKTENFYHKYGAKTIIFARFIPIVRTFAPFVAGVGKMKYSRFFSYNVIGGIIWAALFLFGGYYFGRIEWVSNNLSIVIIGIIIISIIPGVIEFIREYRLSSKNSSSSHI